MNCIENIIYSFNFLLNKYLGFTIIENILNWFENRMIHKYISKEEIIVGSVYPAIFSVNICLT